MQVAINPSLYGTAQSYAEQRGLNLTLMIENYLERFINKEKAKAKEQELPDIVVSLLGSTGGQLREDDLNGRKAYHNSKMHCNIIPQ